MSATINAQATQNVNIRQSIARVAGIRTQQTSLTRPMYEHLMRSWRRFGDRALKRIRDFKACWHRAMSCVGGDADSMPGALPQVVVQRLVWVPVRSVVV